jgi:hypothetical protein
MTMKTTACLAVLLHAQIDAKWLLYVVMVVPAVMPALTPPLPPLLLTTLYVPLLLVLLLLLPLLLLCSSGAVLGVLGAPGSSSIG